MQAIKNYKLLFLVGVMILAAVLSACSGVAAAQSNTPTPGSPTTAGESPRTVSVTGSGKTFLTPDIAYITIGVHTEAKDAEEAVAANNAQAKEVTDALIAAGIDAKDIQTTNFSIYPQQQFDGTGRPTGEITYVVDNSVYVTVRDLAQIGELLDTAVTSGANSIYGVQFDVADKTAALSDARKAAVSDARRVAEELAQAAGVSLGDVQSISTFGGAGPMPFYEGRGGVASQVDSSVPISPGQMTVSVDVTVTYAIQ